MTARDMLVAMAIYYQGDWKALVKAISKKEYLPVEEARRLIRENKSKAITMLDQEYPSYLKEFYMPPLVLFYYGDISLLNDYKKNLGVVGTRSPTEVGANITNEIVKDLAKDYVIVSGMAKGIDRLAHQQAIENGGKTIAILGCGIEICYPSENRDIYEIMKQNHLVISEYPGLCSPDSIHFPIRNRLIVQLSNGILVTEAKLRSGTSITIKYALSYNKNVMCVPSVDFDNSGCNSAIRDGAILVENSDHVKEMMEKFIF